jgi:hypothetical protein
MKTKPEYLRSMAWPAAVLLFLIAANYVASAEPASRERAKTRSAKSLDDQLLEELGAAPRERAGREQNKAEDAEPEVANGEDEKPSSKARKTRSLDDELLEGLEGDDIALAPDSSEENPLVRLNRRMKQVERRIADARGDEKTQRLQREIAADLSKLIAQLEWQCSECKKQSSASSRPQPGQPKPSTNPAQQASDKPAQDSSSRTKEKETAKVDRAKMQEMLKDFWGHLPPHLRQQMEQSANEEFLPKYELEIADYYRSLLRGSREKK